MGDVYRGLTIQIGADVTNLTAALKGVNKAASNTQSALRRVGKALDADPTNVALLSSKMASLSEKASATAVKMRVLGQQIKQMQGTEIEKIANGTKNLELRAASARDEYARLVRQIATLRTNAVTAFDMPAAWGNNLTKYSSQIDAKLKSLVWSGNAEAKKMLTQLTGLQQKFKAVSDEMDKVGKAQSFKRAQEDIKLTASELKLLIRETTETRNQMLALGNTSGLRKVNAQLEKTDELTEQVKAEFKVLNEALSLNPSSLKVAASRMMNLRQQVDLAKQRVTQLKAKMVELEAAGGKKTNKGIRELAEATLTAKNRMESLKALLKGVEGSLETAENEANEFRKALDFKGLSVAEADVKDLRAQVNRLTVALNEAERAYDAAKTDQNLREVQNEIKRTMAQIKNLNSLAKGASGSMSGMFFALRTAGYSLSGTVGAAVSTVAYSLVDKAETIDAAFRDMKKTVQGTDEQFATLRKDAIEYSKTHITSADTILEIEAMAGQLGIATDELETFATTVSNLDISTDMEAEDIAIDLGKLSNVLGDLDTDNVDKFADALVRLGNNNAALESDIMNITTRFGSMASQVGMSSDEILAWATAASSTGVKAESAGSNMLKTLGNINSVVSSGGDTLKAWSKVIGMSADEIKKKWGDSKGGTSDVFQSFIASLSKMKNTDVDATLQKLGITSVRQRQLIEGLTQSVDTMDDKLKMSKDAWNGISDEWGQAGDAANEADQKSEGFSGAMGKLRNNLAAIADSVGTDLIPYIEMATNALKELSDIYNSLDSGQKDSLFKIAAGLTALGPGLTVVGALGSTFTILAKGVGKAANIAGDAGARIKHFGDKLSGVTNAVAGTTGAVTSATSGITGYSYAGQKATKVSGDISKSGQTAAKGITKLSSAGSKAGKALQSIGGSFNWWALGIGAVALACGTLYGAWQEAKERAETFDEVLTGSEETLLSWGESVNEAADNAADLSDTVKSISEIKDANYELAKSVASHNEEMQASMKEAKVDISMLESYGDTVDKISKKVQKGKITKKSDLSSEELGELKSALEGINELTGKNYTIKDIIQKGEVDKAKKINDELQKTLTLKELSLQSEVYAERYKSALSDQIDAQEKYSDAVKTFNETYATYSDLANTPGVSIEAQQFALGQISAAQDAMNEAKSSLDSINSDVDKWQQAMDTVNAASAKGVNSIYTLLSQNSQAFATLSSGGYLKSFMSDLDELGVKYKNLTKNQKTDTSWLSTLASSYDGTTSSLTSSLDSLGIKYDKTKAKASKTNKNLEKTNSLKKEVKKPVETKVSANTKSAEANLKAVQKQKEDIAKPVSFDVTANVKHKMSSGGSSSNTQGTVGMSASSVSSGTRAVYDDGTVGLMSLASTVDDSYGVMTQGIYDSVSSAVSGMNVLSLGLGNDVKSMSKKLGNGVTVNMSSDNGEIAGLLRSIVKNTKGGQGIYLDGNKLVGGTADAYDRKMAQRERLASRGVSI